MLAVKQILADLLIQSAVKILNARVFKNSGNFPFLSGVFMTNLSVSLEGNIQEVLGLKEQLLNIVLNSLITGDTFYHTRLELQSTVVQLIAQLHKQNESKFIFNLAVFARHVLGLKQAPLDLLTSYLLTCTEFPTNSYKILGNYFYRVDDMLKLVGNLLESGLEPKELPKILKKSLNIGLNKFDAYQFGKYNRKVNGVNLKFLILTARPQPKNEEQSRIFKCILDNTLETPETHEVLLSDSLNNATPQARIDSWLTLLRGDKLGYQALIKNLANIERMSISSLVTTESLAEVQSLVRSKLVNENSVARSKLYPYQFYSAIAKTQSYKTEVIQALGYSVNNVPQVSKKACWLVVDASLSMQGAPMNNSAFLTAIICKSLHNYNIPVFITTFGTTSKNIEVTVNDTYQDIVNKISNFDVGGGTNLASIADNTPNVELDTVFMFSDMQIQFLSVNQSFNSFFNNIKHKFAFNMGQSPTSAAQSFNGWMQFAGYSDNILQYLNIAQDAQSLTDMLSV